VRALALDERQTRFSCRVYHRRRTHAEAS